MQGFHVEKRTERFLAGKPDLRVGRKDLGQLDVELKYLDWPKQSIIDAVNIDTGMKKIQWLNMRTYNEHGIPAICLIYVEAYDQFWITTHQVLHRPLRFRDCLMLNRLPSPHIIDGPLLFELAKEHLRNVGY